MVYLYLTVAPLHPLLSYLSYFTNFSCYARKQVYQKVEWQLWTVPVHVDVDETKGVYVVVTLHQGLASPVIVICINPNVVGFSYYGGARLKNFTWLLQCLTASCTIQPGNMYYFKSITHQLCLLKVFY